MLNICPTKRLKSIIPEEAWSRYKPMVRDFRIFVLYDEKKGKLDYKSETLILVRYHPTNASKIYSLVKQQILISRYVIVDEAESWNWLSESKTHIPFFWKKVLKFRKTMPQIAYD